VTAETVVVAKEKFVRVDNKRDLAVALVETALQGLDDRQELALALALGATAHGGRELGLYTAIGLLKFDDACAFLGSVPQRLIKWGKGR